MAGGLTASEGFRAEYQPPGARVKLRERRGSLRIDIPPASISSPEKLGLAGFALTWNVGIGVWTASAVAAGSLAAAAFSIPFWAAGRIALAHHTAAARCRVTSLPFSSPVLPCAQAFQWRGMPSSHPSEKSGLRWAQKPGAYPALVAS